MLCLMVVDLVKKFVVFKFVVCFIMLLVFIMIGNGFGIFGGMFIVVY